MKTEIKINGTLVFEIQSKNHWVNAFPGAIPEIPQRESYLWVDAQGNIATCGGDFMHADKIDTYPIKVYWLQRIEHLKQDSYFLQLSNLFKP